MAFLFQLRFFRGRRRGDSKDGCGTAASVAELEGVAEETPSPGGSTEGRRLLPWPSASTLLPVCTVSRRVYPRNGQARGRARGAAITVPAEERAAHLLELEGAGLAQPYYEARETEAAGDGLGG